MMIRVVWRHVWASSVLRTAYLASAIRIILKLITVSAVEMSISKPSAIDNRFHLICLSFTVLFYRTAFRTRSSGSRARVRVWATCVEARRRLPRRLETEVLPGFHHLPEPQPTPSTVGRSVILCCASSLGSFRNVVVTLQVSFYSFFFNVKSACLTVMFRKFTALCMILSLVFCGLSWYWLSKRTPCL